MMQRYFFTLKIDIRMWLIEDVGQDSAVEQHLYFHNNYNFFLTNSNQKQIS